MENIEFLHTLGWDYMIHRGVHTCQRFWSKIIHTNETERSTIQITHNDAGDYEWLIASVFHSGSGIKRIHRSEYSIDFCMRDLRHEVLSSTFLTKDEKRHLTDEIDVVMDAYTMFSVHEE